MRQDRRLLEALAVVERFPATSRAVARITGMPNKSASSRMSILFKLGAVTRERLDPAGRSRPPYLYRVKA